MTVSCEASIIEGGGHRKRCRKEFGTALFYIFKFFSSSYRSEPGRGLPCLRH